jgi:hypothetical protein
MTKTISVRITDSEFEKIQQCNNESGLNVNEFLKSAITQSLEPTPIIKEKIKTPNQDVEKIQNRFKEIEIISDDAKKDIATITKKIEEMSQMKNKEPKKMKCVITSDLDLHLDKLESINHSCPYG